MKTKLTGVPVREFIASVPDAQMRKDCQQLVRKLVGIGANDQPAEIWVKEELKSLRRFAEPAIQFAISQTSDPTQLGRLKVILATVRNGR